MKRPTFTFVNTTNENDQKFYQRLSQDLIAFIGNKTPNEKILNLTETVLSHSFVRLPIVLDKTLTLREKEFLYLVSRGKSLKVIAQIMGIELPTVETYRASILRKLLCNNLAEAVSLGIKYGINPQHISM